MSAKYRHDFSIQVLDRIDSGELKTPPGWKVTDEWDCDVSEGVERWWVQDDEAPEELNGKLVSVTISWEGSDFGDPNARVYISRREVIPE